MNAAKMLLRTLGKRFPIADGTITVPGVGTAITIRRDRFGIPYIEAAGDVAITGSVDAGAEISAGGSVTVQQGIVGAETRVRAGGEFKMPKEKIMDLKIADYLVDVEPEEGTDYQRALIMAMHNDKAAFKLYTDLAAAADDQKVKDLMMSLANEEAKHKLRFEIEYDDNILMEN